MKRNNLLLLPLQLHTGNLLGHLYQHQHEEIGFRKSRLITLKTDQLFYLHPFKDLKKGPQKQELYLMLVFVRLLNLVEKCHF